MTPGTAEEMNGEDAAAGVDLIERGNERGVELVVVIRGRGFTKEMASGWKAQQREEVED